MTISRNLSILAEGVSASGVLAVTNGGTGVTTSTGTGSTVLSASPTLTGLLTMQGSASSGNYSAISVDNNAGGAGVNTVSYNFSSGGSIKNSITGAVYGNGYLVFSTNDNTEKMRIDASGNLLVGETSSVNGGSVISVAAGTVCSIITAATASTNMIVFRNGNGNVGSITTSGTATSYNTGSDYRLKHDVEPMTSGLATLAALNPVTYKWNADDSDGEGFIAHELAEVIPLAVTGEKDAVDKDGKPVHQGVDYSKIVVYLVAAIQELSAKNGALEARLTALEAK